METAYDMERTSKDHNNNGPKSGKSSSLVKIGSQADSENDVAVSSVFDGCG